MCEHEFEYEDKNWRNSIVFDAVGNLRIPVVCTKCKIKADEVWTDFLYADRETGDVI